MDQPWFVVTLIICVGSALWLAACVAVAAVVRYRRRRKLLASNKYINGAKPGKSVSSGLRNPTYTKRLEILGIDSLELLRRHYDLVYVFKMFFLVVLSLLPSAEWEMSTGQEAVAVLCGREGNRWLNVILALWFIHLLAKWPTLLQG